MRAEKIWKEISEMRLLIQAYQDIADVYRNLKQYDQCEKYLNLSLEMSSLIKAPDLLVNNYLRFSRLDSARGNDSQALIHLYKYTTLKDSVYNLAKTEQIARLQMMFESEEKERENSQLRSEQLFRESQLNLQRQIIYAISTGLLLTGVMAWFLYRQRHKILSVNKILRDTANLVLDTSLALEKHCFFTEDHKEAIRSFVEKREPKFTGR